MANLNLVPFLNSFFAVGHAVPVAVFAAFRRRRRHSGTADQFAQPGQGAQLQGPAGVDEPGQLVQVQKVRNSLGFDTIAGPKSTDLIWLFQIFEASGVVEQAEKIEEVPGGMMIFDPLKFDL